MNSLSHARARTHTHVYVYTYNDNALIKVIIIVSSVERTSGSRRGRKRWKMKVQGNEIYQVMFLYKCDIMNFTIMYNYAPI